MEKLSTCDLREKDVVNVCDGRNLGCVTDFIIDTCEGKITALIVPTPRTKLYTKALKKAPFESGKIIVKYVLIFPAPKEDAASSSDVLI